MREKQYRKPHQVGVRQSQVRKMPKVIRPFSRAKGKVRSLSSSPLPLVQPFPTNLQPLIGREREIEAIRVLLQQPKIRLLTLTGTGGIGKTRLAWQISAEVSSIFTDGVYFVSLASISTGDRVLPAIAQALNIRKKTACLPFDQVQAKIRDRKILLLLDNFEQVVDAAPQLKALLAACPHLKLLITSRTILKVVEEQIFSVAPLALPDLAQNLSCDELAQVASVALFLQRVRAIRADFALTSENAQDIAQICIRLDGLPLALELAAARMKLFSPQNLLAKLDRRLSLLSDGARDAPERQQTLRKTIGWSYRLLTPGEQRLFRSLAVFVDGCSFQAIESITKIKEEFFLNALTSLLDHSLLQRKADEDEKQRFIMLETIREYALECLHVSNEEEETRKMHAEYYLDTAKAFTSRILAGETISWAGWIESEFENLRAAFGWLFSTQEVEHDLKADTLSPLILCFVGMGIHVALRKHYAWAVSLWGKARTFSKMRNSLAETDPCERLTTILATHPLYSQAMKAVRTQLGEQTFHDIWRKGQSMTIQHVLAEPGPPILSLKPSSPAKAYCDELTSREKEVLHLLSQGLSSALIAKQLVISLTTVNSHIRTIYNKLGVSCRSAATRLAIERHIV